MFACTRETRRGGGLLMYVKTKLCPEFTSPHPDKYKSVTNQLVNKFGADAGRTIPVRNIALPDVSLPQQLPYNDHFSLFVPAHRRMAGKLIDIFMNMRDVNDLQSLCSYCQLRINPHMFNYCLSVAILHRPDTKGLNIPTLAENFPDKFVDQKVVRKAREITTTVQKGERTPIVIPQATASDLEPEQRVAYFREDIGINLHHWHWHLVYPFESADVNIVNKDRRGELFYYMHQQIIARYNTERMCNNLARVEPYQDFRGPISEGYFPKLNSQVASRAWPPRFAHSRIQDLDRPVDLIRADVYQLEIWRDRFLEAIEAGAILLPNGRTHPLDEATGIDVLGNLMESSIISRNRSHYGDLHNMGHVFISFAHDPDNRHLENFGVMGDSATAMRDPVFYRWHAHVDDIFNLHKAKLPAYTPRQLEFPAIRVSSIGVEGRGGANTLRTQWEQSTVELSRGLDFMPRGSMLARFEHLQHDDFNYVIEVDNTSGASLMGTVRIFIAPVADERGHTLPFEEQRRLMIELDKFSQGLRPGNNTIRHRSTESSVTIPYERTFRNQERRPGDPGSTEAAEFDFCGCGWPHHMLLPKGTAQGYKMVLFVMVSNWMEDRIEQDLVGSCNDAASYCGIRDRKYPDRKAMGYPFDRPNPARALSDFLRPNMAVRECSINFTDATRVRGQRS
ncbi:phenoloxidase subunit 1-like isoform X2 [Choristoneura fumiferana]|uniref:phenoloxidase subunit 1-like isoform X2 n=1 Tax=Choristoneura fumiferana TaxID=7141 RepID=UPI003D158CB3